MFLIWLAATTLEVSLHYSPPGWPRTIGAVSIIALLAFAAGLAPVVGLGGYGVIFALLSGYRIVNLFRILQNQMHERYLQRVTRSTFWTLLGLQAVTLAAWWPGEVFEVPGQTVWLIAAVASAAVALVALLSVMRTLKRTAWPRTNVHFSDKELPTVTVAVPARNESADLQACLQSILASDYPKLEILVLDDCSQTKRTPEIIRSFAHAGVRFLQGKEPTQTWFAKNWAYEQLRREASGDYILFLGVDVRLSPHSIRHLITVLLERKKSLVSILPERGPEVHGVLSLLQPMRYWWELVPPRRLFNRPPVLSTCWIADADMLKRDGGFAAVSRAIVPEAHFARKAMERQDGYSFMRSNHLLGLYSVKRISAQRETAVRMRYPQVHRRPEQVAIVSLLEGGLLVAPFIMAVAGFWVDIGLPAHILSILAAGLLVITHELVALHTSVNSWWFGLIAAPWMFVVDIAYLHYSMWRYEFSKVEWKGRNVCIPVMHVVPHLPEIEQR